MELTRLMIADERRPGRVPAGVLIVSLLHDVGCRLKVFIGGIDETTLRAVEIITGERATVLDPLLCGSRDNLRALFQTAADPSALNIILTDLGGRWSDDAPFVVSEECGTLCSWLECDMIPVVYSGKSSTLAVRAVSEITRQLSARGDMRGEPRGVIFKQVLSERELQLIERELGRSSGMMTIGSIPIDADPREPLVTDLCGERTQAAMRETITAAERLGDDIRAEMRARLTALARLSAHWETQAPLVGAVSRPIPRVAILRDPALSLGGDGTELFMKSIGVDLVDIHTDPSDAPADAAGVYIPHGLGYRAITRLAASPRARVAIKSAADDGHFLLAEGGAAPLAGELISLPRGTVEGTGRGVGVFPFMSIYGSPVFSSPQRMTATTRRKRNPLLRTDDEHIRGYMSHSLTIAPIGDEAPYCWRLSREEDAPEEFSDGIARGPAMATSMRLEPWSAPRLFKRWLEESAQ